MLRPSAYAKRCRPFSASRRSPGCRGACWSVARPRGDAPGLQHRPLLQRALLLGLSFEGGEALDEVGGLVGQRLGGDGARLRRASPVAAVHNAAMSPASRSDGRLAEGGAVMADGGRRVGPGLAALGDGDVELIGDGVRRPSHPWHDHFAELSGRAYFQVARCLSAHRPNSLVSRIEA